jgi:hypothetical protein
MTWIFSQPLLSHCANSPCSPDLVAASSLDISLDGALCALWSGTATQPASWLPAKTTDACHRFRSGMTFKPLMDDRGEAVLMSFLAGFPAKTSPAREKEQDSTATAPACGATWPASSAKYDPDSRSWKTAQCSLFGGLELFLETWPRWGTMRGGEFWEQSMPAHLTGGAGSGLSESWPTPTAQDCKNNGAPSQMERNTLPLNAAVKASLATPQARDYRTGQQSRWDDPERTRNLNDQIGGQLNPDWVELLMGWPKGWTSLDPLDPQEFARWVEAHAKGTVWEPEAWEVGTPRIASGTVKRVDRLRCIGNGQVPNCASLAFQILTTHDHLT